MKWIAQLVEDTRLLSIILPRQKSAGLRMAGDSIEKATTDRKQVLSLDGVLYIGKLGNCFLDRDGGA